MVRIKDILRKLYPIATFRTGEAVYLTFDDGPIPEVTPQVLAILERYNVKATFFMVGDNIDKHPEVFLQVLNAGHSVGNHTYHHVKGFRYSRRHYLNEVALCQAAITRHSAFPLTGNPSPVTPHPSPLTGSPSPLFRPPYGRAWLWQRVALRKKGYRLIYWDVLTRDYEPTRSPEDMLTQIKQETRPGSIINFHDSLKSNERMLSVLPQAIEWLLSQGYKLDKL